MPNELQAALAEGAAELEKSAGETFVYAGQSFKAWRVQNFVKESGKLESAPDSFNTFEAIRSTAPALERGFKLTDGDGGIRRVGEVFLTDPTLKTFRFTMQ